MDRLTGAALVAHVEQSIKAGIKKSDMVAAAGYVKQLPDGKTRVMLAAFNEALLEARGIKIGGCAPKVRKLSYATQVLGNGNAVIGQAYLSKIGATHGEKLSIEVKGKRLILAVIPAKSTATTAEAT